MKHKIKRAIYSLRTSIRRLNGASDHGRWSNGNELLDDWDERTRAIAALIPDSVSVIEFGAGRQVLRSYLKPGCTYMPSDLIDRGCGTIVCDLNARLLPELPAHDYAIFSGVLEYVNDINRLVSHLASGTASIIASYASIENNKKRRRENGWVNDYNTEEFIAIFRSHGFSCKHTEKWRNQTIFVFEKTRAAAS